MSNFCKLLFHYLIRVWWEFQHYCAELEINVFSDVIFNCKVHQCNQWKWKINQISWWDHRPAQCSEAVQFLSNSDNRWWLGPRQDQGVVCSSVVVHCSHPGDDVMFETDKDNIKCKCQVVVPVCWQCRDRDRHSSVPQYNVQDAIYTLHLITT